MNEHEQLGDPAFDRLVAADPARRVPDPVQGVLRAKVDALIAEQADAEPTEPGASGREQAGHEHPGHEQADDLAVRRHRRRTPWLVAAAVAGIVAAGGGGYVAGENGLWAPTADMAAESSGEAPSLLEVPDQAGPEAETLDGTGDLSTATGIVFHAGAGLSETPATAQVRVARTGTLDESLGSYPVISEAEAVERLGDPRFAGAALGGSGQARPSPGAGPRTVPEPGGSIAWPVEDVTIVTAALTEVRYTVSDGTELFLPAYDLADADGNSWTVMAVDEELLDLAP
jgi:hypothetical protein